MNRVAAILVSLLSILFLTCGIVVLMAAAAGSPIQRTLYGLVLLAVGGGLLFVGVRRLRRLSDLRPEVLRTSAIELARRLGGEVTAAQLRAEHRISQEQATRVLEGLVAEGAATREDREERTVYVVQGLLPALAQKNCPYCGTNLPVRSALRKCPNCGGSLESTKT
jgi:hypothetical protein